MGDNRDTQIWHQLLGERFDQLDQIITRWMAEKGIVFLRISLGVVFFWFGVLKLFPDASPATDLIRESITFLPSDIFIPFLGVC